MMHRRVVDGGLRLHKTIYCCLFWNNNSRCELWRENSQNYFIRLFLIQSWRWGILSTALLSPPPFSLSLPSLRKILQRLRGGRIAVGAGSWAPENPGESRRIPENPGESLGILGEGWGTTQSGDCRRWPVIAANNCCSWWWPCPLWPVKPHRWSGGASGCFRPLESGSTTLPRRLFRPDSPRFVQIRPGIAPELPRNRPELP